MYRGDRSKFYPYDTNQRRSVRSNLGFSENKNVILYVGKLNEHHGANIVNDIANLSATSNAIIVVVGDGPIRNKIEENPNIIYPGYVSNDRMPDYYNAADITIKPRKRDLTSNVGLESIACGTPFVTTAKGLIKDLFKENEAYVWAERTPHAVWNKVTELLNDKDKNREQVQRGFNAFDEYTLSLEDALAVHLDVYDKLVNETT